jgi:hypothetical protein
MHRTRVILTVDTEPSVAGAMKDRKRFPPLLHEPIWGEVNGRSEALGFITRTLEHYNLPATFFVETVHTSYFGNLEMKRYTDHLLEAGLDVQLHIHPVWRNFSDSLAPSRHYNDDSAALGEAELTSVIEHGCSQIQEWTGQRPVAMRTGNFSASMKVYRAMANAGLPLASNICIACESYPETSLQKSGGIQKIDSVYELPAACFIDPGPIGSGSYRAAQITACSASELINLLQQCHAQSVDTIVLVTHPFEFIKKADFRYRSMRANRVVQKRLQKLCSFLAANRDRFQAITFSDLAEQLPLSKQAAPALQSSRIKSFLRASQNFINDRI